MMDADQWLIGVTVSPRQSVTLKRMELMDCGSIVM
jgi:hypothetical protein